MARHAQQWADAHSDELHSALDELGATGELPHALVEVRVPHRHSFVKEIYNWSKCEKTVLEAVEIASRLGGHFFQKVLEGDPLEAFKIADSNNRRVIAEVYSKEHLLSLTESQNEANIVEEQYPK